MSQIRKQHPELGFEARQTASEVHGLNHFKHLLPVDRRCFILTIVPTLPPNQVSYMPYTSQLPMAMHYSFPKGLFKFDQ